MNSGPSTMHCLLKLVSSDFNVHCRKCVQLRFKDRSWYSVGQPHAWLQTPQTFSRLRKTKGVKKKLKQEECKTTNQSYNVNRTDIGNNSAVETITDTIAKSAKSVAAGSIITDRDGDVSEPTQKHTGDLQNILSTTEKRSTRNIYKQNSYGDTTAPSIEQDRGGKNQSFYVKEVVSNEKNTNTETIAQLQAKSNKTAKDKLKTGEKVKKMTNAKKLANMQNKVNDKLTALQEKVSVLCSMDEKNLEFASNLIQQNQKYLSMLPYKDKQKIDISVYNCLLRNHAKKGNYKGIKNVLLQIDMWNSTPNLQTYAHCLECLARCEEFDMAEGHDILSRILSQDFNVKNIFTQCSFVNDEWYYVEKALRTLDPGFEANQHPPDTDYSCQLVDGLNSPVSGQKIVNPHKGVLDKREILKKLETQLAWEMQGYVEISTSLGHTMPETDYNIEIRSRLRKMEQKWRICLIDAFQKKLKTTQYSWKIKEEEKNLVPFLSLFPASEYVDLLLLELDDIAKTCLYISPPTSALYERLGNKLLRKSDLKNKKSSGIIDKTKEIYKEYLDEYDSDFQNYRSNRECWLTLSQQEQHRYGATLDLPNMNWSKKTIRNVGSWLYELLLENVKLDANILRVNKVKGKKAEVPVLYVTHRTYGGITSEEMMPHPLAVKAHQLARDDKKYFDVSFMPMLVPPVPWISKDMGGMLTRPIELIKSNHHFVQDDPVENIMKFDTDISAVLDSLTVLGSCPWRINKQILKVMIEVFQNKGNKALNIPPDMSCMPPMPKVDQKMSRKEQFAVWEAKRKIKKIHSENFSLWCTTLYQLALADKLKDELIWFPHNVDFRGRAYPVSPSMNYMGNDLMRGLLLFAKGKPLGEKGLDWMKIHLINLMELKKRSSNKERLEFANENMHKILDSADNPLNGNKWWQNSEDPWTTLATCMEIAAAVRSLDPTKYVSHLPVHQDGSCNGLQHYAALGRDQKGAESVNLFPSQQPNDVYTDVVELVEQQRKKQAAGGVQIAQDLEGFVIRKTIKQTVMTTVYGVTRYGAIQQIRSNITSSEGKELDDQTRRLGSIYLAEETLNSMSKIFSSSTLIQEWFIKCVQVICKHHGALAEWITPLGLPVIQPYSKKIPSYKMDDENKNMYMPNIMKQKNSFPPNFVHSLDATHMMLSGLHCQRKGITYVSVHDCYWTHACDVNIMNKITREQFVALHGKPILEQLSKYFLEKFGHYEGKVSEEQNKIIEDQLRKTFASVPARGDFNLENVMDSEYFFS